MPTKADTSVKWFHSDMPNGPVLRGEAGALIELLDACLINGFDPRTPDSIVVAAGVATVNISAGNPFEQHAVIAITGATPAGLNDEWRIDAITANSFTFICPGIADGTATGTISVKRAPAGWVKPFSDTNIAVYQSDDPTSTQLYLRVNDTGTRNTPVRGYEDMTDASTGVGLFPTEAQLPSSVSWVKSATADATARAWSLYADGSIFYFYTYQGYPVAFGDVFSFGLNDVYNCIIVGSPTAGTLNVNTNLRFLTNGDLGGYIARRADQVTVSPGFRTSGVNWLTSLGNRPMGLSNYQAPVGGATVLRWPVCLTDTSGVTQPLRGYLPGMLEPLHRAFTSVSPTIIEGTGPFDGRLIAGLSIVSNTGGLGSFALDITGPWR